MSTICEDCIYRSYLFNGLSQEEYGLLNLSKKEASYGKGEIIYREGETIKNFLYLKEGLLKVFKTIGKNKEQIIGIAGPRDFIGLLSAFSKSRYIYSISVIEPSEICIIDMKTIQRIIQSNGSFATTLLTKLSQMHDQLLETRLSISQKNLRGRTAYIILMFAVEIYNSHRFDLPISRKEIGELIDMRTENVIRILSEFRKDRIIKIEGKNIEILEMNRLAQISEFG